MGDDDSGHMGKFLKWGLLLFLFGLFPPLFFLWIGWKYVKLCVLFYFKMLYLIIRFPIWLFIQLPLYYIGVGVHKVSEAFSKAYGVMMAKKKRYGLLFGILLFFTLQTFLPRNTDAVISFLTDATLIVPFIFFIPFFITFLVALISAHFRMPDIARKEMPGTYDTGVKRRTAEAGAAAASAGAMGVKAYKNADEIKESKEAAESLASDAADVAGGAAEMAGEGALAGDMVAVLESMPLLGTMVEGGGVAAGAASGAATTIAGMSGGTAILAFIAVLFLGLIGFVIISIIISAFLYGTLIWLTGFLSPVISPILGVLGLGQAYGGWIGETLGNTFLPQIDLEAEMRMVEQAGAKIGCFFKGPQCIQEWRMNNTQRPGSRDVGEKYRLKSKSFSAGGEGGIPIEYKRPGFHIPVDFMLVNSRHGLKGIPARDVRYKVRIVDGDRQGRKAYCTTKDPSEGDNWIEVDSDNYGQGGTILPGTSFSPVVTELEGLTLGNCDMLHPGYGHTFTARLDYQYDYSSQTTLQVDAMSRQHYRDEDIDPIDKRSDTADTPVESFINTEEPITYTEGASGGANSAFRVKIGTATDRFDVEYTVDTSEFTFRDSSKTEHIPGSCTGLDHVSGNRYELSSLAENRIQQRIEEDDIRTWFDKAKNPAEIRCTFELSNPGTISPTGETLRMNLDVNYTVNIEKTTPSSKFEVVNNRCTETACPIVFYLKPSKFDQMLGTTGRLPPEKWQNEYVDPEITPRYEMWKNATCRGAGVGYQQGCSVTDSYDSNYNLNRQSGNSDIVKTIDANDIAVKWNSDTANLRDIFSCYLRANPNGSGAPQEDAVGIPANKVQRSVGTGWKRLNYTGGGFEIVKYETTIQRKQKFLGLFTTGVNTKTVRATSCKDGTPAMSNGGGLTKIPVN